MASPQKEHGYMKIANEIVDALAKIRISGEVGQVLTVVFRQTYGYNRKSDDISLDHFCEKTGMNKPAVSRAIKRALEMKLIIKKDNPNSYEFNKNYEEWQGLSKKITLSKKIISIIKKDNLPPLTLYVSKDNLKDNAETSSADVLKRKKKIAKKADDNDPWSLQDFVSSMRSSPLSHMKFLAEYADEKKLEFKTKGQWRMFIQRNVRPATRISKYSEDQIEKAFKGIMWDLKENRKNPKGFITKWGIETIEKYLDQ